MPLLEINPNPISVACNLGGDPLPWKNQVKSEKKGGQEGQLEEQREGDMGVRPGIVCIPRTPTLRRLGKENHRVLETTTFWLGYGRGRQRNLKHHETENPDAGFLGLHLNPCYPLLTNQILISLSLSFYLLFGDSVTKVGLEFELTIFLPLPHMCQVYTTSPS